VLFLGTFDYAMDERGRLPLPPPYRDAFRGGIVLSQGSPDRCLRVYPRDAFERQAQDVMAEPALSRRAMVMRRGMFHRAHTVEMDGQNRILIPASLREYARLSGKVLVTGTGEFLELWNPEEYDGEAVRVAEEYPAAAERSATRER
jgi:MraZ protein